MAGNIKGLTVEIGAETRGLEAALRNVGKRTADINKELGQVERLLKFDPKNTVLLSQKQGLLADKVNATRERLDALRQAQARVDAMYASGEIDEGQYRAFQRDVESTRNKLKTFEKQLHEVRDAQNGVSKSAGGLGAGLKNMFSGVVVTAGDVVNGLRWVVDKLMEVGRAGAEAEKATRTLQFAVQRAGYSWTANAAALDANIQKVSWLAAVDDEELAVAQSKLIRSTKDLTESQKLLGLATDISAVTGADLNSVTKALSRAYQGNYTGLSRMGVAIDTTKGKTEAFKTLYEQFGGAAEYVSDNLVADADRLKIAWGNLGEQAAKSLGEEPAEIVRMYAAVLAGLNSETLDAGEKFGLLFKKPSETGAEYLARIEEAAGLVSEATDEMTASEYAAAQAQAELNAALEEQYELLKDTANVLSPVEQAQYDVATANLKVKDAQEKYNKAVEEFGPASDEAAVAAWGLEEAKRRQAEQSGQYQAVIDAENQKLEEQRIAALKAADALGALGAKKATSGTGGKNLLTGRASGGDVQGGTTYLVGEEGPELFRSRVSGTIIPTAQTLKMLGGGSTSTVTSQTINYNAPVRTYAETVQAQKDLMKGLFA